jgi:hypothetical protein
MKRKLPDSFTVKRINILEGLIPDLYQYIILDVKVLNVLLMTSKNLRNILYSNAHYLGHLFSLDNEKEYQKIMKKVSITGSTSVAKLVLHLKGSRKSVNHYNIYLALQNGRLGFTREFDPMSRKIKEKYILQCIDYNFGMNLNSILTVKEMNYSMDLKSLQLNTRHKKKKELLYNLISDKNLIDIATRNGFIKNTNWLVYYYYYTNGECKLDHEIDFMCFIMSLYKNWNKSENILKKFESTIDDIYHAVYIILNNNSSSSSVYPLFDILLVKRCNTTIRLLEMITDEIVRLDSSIYWKTLTGALQRGKLRFPSEILYSCIRKSILSKKFKMTRHFSYDQTTRILTLPRLKLPDDYVCNNNGNIDLLNCELHSLIKLNVNFSEETWKKIYTCSLTCTLLMSELLSLKTVKRNDYIEFVISNQEYSRIVFSSRINFN